MNGVVESIALVLIVGIIWAPRIIEAWRRR